ncbi:hypothetical protein FDECE_607 [Fusarium decemcellulare]|nr:hypothetical protein FDECE_607 [Fusarium decemcellulare]
MLLPATCSSFSTPTFAEHLRVVWPQGDFEAISGPSGNEIGHYSGFTIVNDDGNSIYTQDYLDDHSPCYTGDGREFTIEGGCWKQARKFKCICNIAGDPETCEIKDKDSNSFGTGYGQTYTTFIGIAISQESSCAVEFNTEDDEDYPTDNDLHVTSG